MQHVCNSYADKYKNEKCTKENEAYFGNLPCTIVPIPNKKKWENNLRQAEKTYPAFTNGIKETSIFYYKEYRCGKYPYALPSWVAAANYIESDIEVSKHTLTNAKTGFSASKFIKKGLKFIR